LSSALASGLVECNPHTHIYLHTQDPLGPVFCCGVNGLVNEIRLNPVYNKLYMGCSGRSACRTMLKLTRSKYSAACPQVTLDELGGEGPAFRSCHGHQFHLVLIGTPSFLMGHGFLQLGFSHVHLHFAGLSSYLRPALHHPLEQERAYGGIRHQHAPWYGREHAGEDDGPVCKQVSLNPKLGGLGLRRIGPR